MHTEYYRWHSPHLNREMELKIYGHWGAPYVVFPCSNGRFFDYEDMGMVAAIERFIDAGKIKLFAVESVDGESWYDFNSAPEARNQRYEAYDRYLTEELVPFIRDHCHDPHMRPFTTGCSMGAYHSLNIFLKHPDLFDGCIALSGLYRLDRKEFRIAPHEVPAVYFNSPISYLANLDNGWQMDLYRRRRIIVCTGQGAWEAEAIEDTRALDGIFKSKGIPALVDFWGPDVNHDWPWWYIQMNHFLRQLHG